MGIGHRGRGNIDGLMSSEHILPGLAGPPKAPRRLLRSRHRGIFTCGGYESRNTSPALGPSEGACRLDTSGNRHKIGLTCFMGDGGGFLAAQSARTAL